jgi:hypothetical protein
MILIETIPGKGSYFITLRLAAARVTIRTDRLDSVQPTHGSKILLFQNVFISIFADEFP